MFYAKNVSNKPIGFGGTDFVLLPEQSGPLPEGFNEKHPVIGYYLNAKPPFLVKVDGKAEADRLAAEAKAEADRIAAEKAEADRKAADAAKLAAEEAAKAEADRLAAEKAAELDKKLKEVSKMNLDPLRVMATELGIEWTENDTKAVLQTKITEKLAAEQE